MAESGGEVRPRHTGRVTSAGRPVWDAGGEFYSERTITLPYGNGWVVMPTVAVDGSIMPDAAVSRLLDKIGPVDVITNAELPVFGSLDEANRYAEERSARLGREMDEPVREEVKAQGGVVGLPVDDRMINPEILSLIESIMAR